MAEWWSDESLVKVLEEEANQGNPQAMSELARKMILEGNTAEGVDWFQKAADAGDKDAMFNLGLLYEQGWDACPADYSKAYHLFLKGSDAGDTEAMYKAAQYMIQGLGVDPDPKAASKLLEKALGMGYLPAQELLFRIPGMKEEREAKLSLLAEDGKRAEALLEDKEYAQAVPLLTDLLSRCADTLGEMDAYTLQVMNNLAVALASQGQYEKSIPLKERVLELRGKSLPLTHPDYITAMTNLTSDYAHVHRYQTALQFSRQAYTAVRETLPVMHELTFLTANRLACDLMNLCRHDAALEYLKAVTEDVAGASDSGKELLTESIHWKQTQDLLALCQKEVADNELYFSLEESRRSYAYICAELMEMLSALPESYLKKIHKQELDHFAEQAALVGCYKPRMNQGQAVETDPYTNSLQTLLSYKYLMPGLAECREEYDGIVCRALVSWIQNELCLIATVYPETSNLSLMKHPQPVDFVKSLNAYSDDGDRVISIDSADLKIIKEEERIAIKFAYGSGGSYRLINLYYDPESNVLDGDNSFILLA